MSKSKKSKKKTASQECTEMLFGKSFEESLLMLRRPVPEKKNDKKK